LDPTPHKEISILGMHPSELGHTWWAENLYNYVNKNNIYIPKNPVDVVIHNVNQKTKGY
jgi:DNA-binding response OmpR family regulator